MFVSVCVCVCVIQTGWLLDEGGGKKKSKKIKSCEVEGKSSSGGDAADINEDALTSHCESTG